MPPKQMRLIQHLMSPHSWYNDYGDFLGTTSNKVTRRRLYEQAKVGTKSKIYMLGKLLNSLAQNGNLPVKNYSSHAYLWGYPSTWLLIFVIHLHDWYIHLSRNFHFENSAFADPKIFPWVKKFRESEKNQRSEGLLKGSLCWCLRLTRRTFHKLLKVPLLHFNRA